MNQAVAQNLPAYVREFATLSAKLPVRDPQLMRARQEAADLLMARGLPTPHNEAWKYTNLRRLPALEVSPVPSLTVRSAEIPDALLPARLAFVDGVFRPDLSSLNEKTDGATWRQGIHAPAIQTADHPLQWLNTAFATEGGTLDITNAEPTGAVIEMTFFHSGNEALALHWRPHIRLHAGARAVILERHIGQASYLTNTFLSVTLELGAALEHVRIQQDDVKAHHLSLTDITLAAGATYRQTSLTLGALLSRHENIVRLTGRDARMQFTAIQILQADQTGDVTLDIDHATPQTQSDSIHRAVLSGHAHGVFQGKIGVARNASGTDGRQHSQALLLSPDAVMDTKPELEIFTDDVKCAHGATVGTLDDSALFYLRARGIDLTTARLMLIEAFLSEALERIGHEKLRVIARDAALKKLGAITSPGVFVS